TIVVAANAADVDGRITAVQLYADDALLHSSTSSPFTFEWSGAPAGTHVLRVVASDDAGATASLTRTVKVNQPPMVAFDAPAADGVFTAGEAIAISVHASD